MKKPSIYIICFNLAVLIILTIGYILSENMVPLPVNVLIDNFLGAIFLLIFINLALGTLLTIASLFFRKLEGYGPGFLLAFLACTVIIISYITLSPNSIE